MTEMQAVQSLLAVTKGTEKWVSDIFFHYQLGQETLCIKLTNDQFIDLCVHASVSVCTRLCLYMPMHRHWLRCQRSMPGVFPSCLIEVGSLAESGTHWFGYTSWPGSPCGLPISADVRTRVIDGTAHSWCFTRALGDLDSDKLLTGSFPQALDRRNLTLMWKIKYVELYSHSLRTLPSLLEPRTQVSFVLKKYMLRKYIHTLHPTQWFIKWYLIYSGFWVSIYIDFSAFKFSSHGARGCVT